MMQLGLRILQLVQSRVTMFYKKVCGTDKLPTLWTVAETERVEAIYPVRLTAVENDLVAHKED